MAPVELFTRLPGIPHNVTLGRLFATSIQYIPNLVAKLLPFKRPVRLVGFTQGKAVTKAILAVAKQVTGVVYPVVTADGEAFGAVLSAIRCGIGSASTSKKASALEAAILAATLSVMRGEIVIAFCQEGRSR
jgi:hypothetical protein